MEDERWEPGMPVLDRQAIGHAPPRPPAGGGLPPSLAALPARSVPEIAPTPLQKQFVYLSVVVFFCGAIAITALELGATFASPLVKLCVLIAAPLLILTTADAALRIWRSVLAWWGVNRGRALFRLAWLVPAGVLIALSLAALVVVLPA